MMKKRNKKDVARLTASERVVEKIEMRSEVAAAKSVAGLAGVLAKIVERM
jgi:hypothetical protein